MSLSFASRKALVQYLADHGHGLLKEALELAGPQAIVDHLFPVHIPRQKVLVKAYRDGLIEVYGSPVVDAKILLLGRSNTIPECEIEQERWVDEVLPPPYKDINWPSCKRAAALKGLD